MIDKNMIAFCGTYCGVCEWKDKIGCKGCKANKGIMFWGECDKAKCCMEKELEHCGECLKMPCQKLRELFGDSEHGDHGARLRNLNNWKVGNYVYEKLGNTAQRKAKELKSVGEDMKMVIQRFLASGMTMEEVAVKMDASIEDLTKLLNS